MKEVQFIRYIKDAAMWRKVDTTVIHCDPLAIADMADWLGYSKTSYGTYWKQTACDEAEEIIVAQ